MAAVRTSGRHHERTGSRRQSAPARGLCDDRRAGPVRRLGDRHRYRRKGARRRRFRLLQPAVRAWRPAGRRGTHRASGRLAGRSRARHRDRQPGRPVRAPRVPARPDTARQRRRRPRGRPFHPAAHAAGDRSAARRALPAGHGLEAPCAGARVCGRTGGCGPGLRGGRGGGPAHGCTAHLGAGARTRPPPRPGRTWARRLPGPRQCGAHQGRFASGHARCAAHRGGAGAHRRHGRPRRTRRRERGRHLPAPADHRERLRLSDGRRASRVRTPQPGRVRGVLPRRRAVAPNPVRTRVHRRRCGLGRRTALERHVLDGAVGQPPHSRRTGPYGRRGARTDQCRAGRRGTAPTGRRSPAHGRGPGAQRRHGGPRLLRAHLARGPRALGPGRRGGLPAPRGGREHRLRTAFPPRSSSDG